MHGTIENFYEMLNTCETLADFEVKAKLASMWSIYKDKLLEEGFQSFKHKGSTRIRKDIKVAEMGAIMSADSARIERHIQNMKFSKEIGIPRSAAEANKIFIKMILAYPVADTMLGDCTHAQLVASGNNDLKSSDGLLKSGGFKLAVAKHCHDDQKVKDVVSYKTLIALHAKFFGKSARAV